MRPDAPSADGDPSTLLLEPGAGAKRSTVAMVVLIVLFLGLAGVAVWKGGSGNALLAGLAVFPGIALVLIRRGRHAHLLLADSGIQWRNVDGEGTTSPTRLRGYSMTYGKRGPTVLWLHDVASTKPIKIPLIALGSRREITAATRWLETRGVERLRDSYNAPPGPMRPPRA